MPRYFFHIHDGKDIIDNEGTELPDLAAARKAAVQMAGTTVAEQGEDFWNHGEWELEVTDEDGLVLLKLIFTGTISPVVRAAQLRNPLDRGRV